MSDLDTLLTMIRSAKGRTMSEAEIARAETLAERAMEHEQNRKEILDSVFRDMVKAD